MLNRIIAWFKSLPVKCMQCGLPTKKEHALYNPGWAGGDSDRGYECLVCAESSGLKASYDRQNAEQMEILEKRRLLNIS